MPSDEEVTQRAGSLQALTGFTERACTVLRPLSSPPWRAIGRTAPSLGHSAPAAGTVRMATVPDPQGRTSGSAS
jgi:hypothetical protein